MVDYKVIVSKRAAQAFDLVVWWYGCTESEVEEMRRAYRADPDTAGESFAEMCRRIELAIRVDHKQLDLNDPADLELAA